MSSLFRQNFTDPDRRRETTVARDELLAESIAHLKKQAAGKESQHLLFVGSRGIGKSHLLSVIADQIQGDKDLCKKFHIVRFPEEANRVLSLADFLLGLVEILRDTQPEEELWKELYQKYETEESDQIILDAIAPALKNQSQKTNTHFVVMLENLNELLEHQIRKREERRAFRDFFEQTNGCLLIATSPIAFDEYRKEGCSFHNFFLETTINHLTQEETVELIRNHLNADEKDEYLKDNYFEENLRPKLYALFRLTAGTPRLSMMLYGLITDDSIHEIRKQLETLLDRITPFYQDRLNDLPPQERATLETIACMRSEEKTPKAISAKLRLSQQQTSNLLKRLSESNYLSSSKHPTDGRQRLYRIKEGFFDIWLYMNNSRVGKKRIPILLDFFALIYPTLEEREKKRAQYREEYGTEADQVLDYFSELGPDTERFPEKIRLARRDLNSSGNLYLQEARNLQLDPMGSWLAEHAHPNYLDEIEELIECWEDYRTGNLEAFSSRLMEIASEINYKSFSETKLSFIQEHLEEIPEGGEKTKLRLHAARILTDQARWSEVEKQLRLAHQETPQSSELYPTVLNDLSQLLQKTNRLDEAELLLNQALEIYEQSLDKKHPSVAICLNNLAQLFQDTNRLNEAEPLMRRSLDIIKSSFKKGHPNIAVSLNNLSLLLLATNREEEATSLMKQALEIDEKFLGKNHPSVATRLNNLALILKDTNRPDEAEPLVRRSLIINEQNFGENHPNIAPCLNNLAILLQKINRLDEAEPLIERALKIDEASFGKHHPNVARDLNTLALLLLDTRRPSEAKPLLQRAIQIMEVSLGKDHPNTIIVRENLETIPNDSI